MRACLRQALLAVPPAAKTAIILLALVGAALIGSRALMADEPPPGTTPFYPAPNDRLGFGAAKGAVTDYDVASLVAGWYYDWGVGVDPPHPGELIYAHMIRVPVTDTVAIRAAVAQAALTDPGALWLIGNEPDVATMDNVLPELYAESYDRAYRLIKAYDPTAIVAPGGVVMPTALRLCYLNKILYAYEARSGRPLPADAWHVHNYVLNEQRGKLPGVPPGFCTPYGELPGLNGHDDMEQFSAQVRAMRGWMALHGYGNLPLIISEYGILYPQQRGFDYYRVRDFMRASFDYLLSAADPTLGYPPDAGHLVQTWNWYSLDDTNYAGSGLTWGALFDPLFKQRLPMGDAWADYVTGNGLRVPYTQVVPAAIRLAADEPPYYGETSPVTVRALALNRGNAPAAEPFEVAIYAGEPGQGGTLLGSQVVSGLPARYQGAAWVEVAWTVPATATWTLTAQISGANRSLTLGRRIDLHLDRIDVAPASRVQVLPGETTTLTLTATVYNYGNVGVRDVMVRFWEEGRTGAQGVLGTQSIPTLPVLASAQAVFVWPEVAPGSYQVTAEVVLPPEVPEDDLTNNQARQAVSIFSHELNLPLVSAVPGCVTQDERNLLRNGSFETGDLTSWQVEGWPIVQEDAPHSVDGSYYAWLGMRDNAHDALTQAVTLPKRAFCVVLLYAWGIYTTETCDAASPKDRLTVSLRDPGGQILELLETLSECDATEYWHGRAVDLHAYAGQTIQVHFQVDTNASAPSYIALDDIHVQVWAGE